MSIMIEVSSCVKCPIRMGCKVYVDAVVKNSFGHDPLDEFRILAGCPYPRVTANRERKEIYSIEKVFENVNCDVIPKRGENIVMFDGDPIDMGSKRYYTFKRNGVVCCECGIKGVFFAKERIPSDKGKMPNKWHLELYALNDSGREILMTKDHIIPKSKGGSDQLDNLRTMCFYCNCKRGNGDGN